MTECVVCPYCNMEANKVSGEFMYPHRPDLYHLSFYYCDYKHEAAYVGTHKDGKPYGTLADAATRVARNKAHRSFDRLWKEKLVTRNQAYSLLTKHMNITPELTHIGMFNVEQAAIAEQFGQSEYFKRSAKNERKH